jgi:hypothetical protein
VSIATIGAFFSPIDHIGLSAVFWLHWTAVLDESILAALGPQPATASNGPRVTDVEDDVVLFVSPETRDLAPMIHRQRLVIEGTPREPISVERVCDYLTRLSDVCGMKMLIDPVTHHSDKYGWAGWIHWEASGAHFYAWDKPMLFFSVDIYACKPFDAVAITRFTREHLDAREVVARAF